MTQITTLEVKQWLKKYAGYLLAALFLFMLTRSCGSEELARAEIRQRETENKALYGKLNTIGKDLKEKDKVINQSYKKIAKMEAKEATLLAQLEKEKKKGAIALAKTKNFDLKEWRDYFVDRTKLPKDISLGTNTVNFTKEPLQVMGQDLISGDVAKAQLKIKTESLYNARNIISEKDSIIKNQNRKIFSMGEALSIKDIITDNLNKDKVDLLRALSKANKPKIGTILISVGVGAIGGVLLAK